MKVKKIKKVEKVKKVKKVRTTITDVEQGLKAVTVGSWSTLFLLNGSKDFLDFSQKVRQLYKEKNYRAGLAVKNCQIFFGALLC